MVEANFKDMDVRGRSSAIQGNLLYSNPFESLKMILGECQTVLYRWEGEEKDSFIFYKQKKKQVIMSQRETWVLWS